MEATDAELIGRARSGDSNAFARLAARWEGKAYALAYRFTLDAHESEDIRQTALIRAYQALRTFKGDASFSTWFYRVVLNLCRDRHRMRLVRDNAQRRARRENGGHVRIQRSADAAVEQAETKRRVAEAVKSLPRAMREVVIMRHYEDLPFARIAEILDAPVSTVKSRMAKGLRLLRHELEDVEQ
ncbi:MAG: sigma-70 family RNA polymerase sigma factor [Planctomycetota bacterium]|jgi:RNA polymerase sigma-70 factor (ECF subfamily)